MASFSVSGLVPMSAAMAGSEVAMTVESMFSMNRAVATMSGIRRSLFMGFQGDAGEDDAGWLYHPSIASAIAEPAKPPKSCAPKPLEIPTMIYVLAALLPPLGQLFNGQPFSAIFNLVL